MKPEEIFNDEDRERLLQCRLKLGYCQDILDRCKHCGMDVAEKQARKDEMDQALALIEQAFMMPGGWQKVVGK